MRQGVYRLPDDVARRVRLGHPWVFGDALGARKVTEPTGSLVDLVGGNRGFIGRGYVDREHPIAIRVITRNSDENVHPGSGAIATRFARAVKLRWEVLGTKRPTALRLFSGENEGLPGVTVDRYGDFDLWCAGGAGLLWRGERDNQVAGHTDLRARELAVDAEWRKDHGHGLVSGHCCGSRFFVFALRYLL